MPTAYDEEMCPKCGNWVSSLNEETGWCLDCSPKVFKPFDWFSEHADALDRKLVEGLSLKEAIKKVADEIRPTCLCCGDPIARGVSKAYGRKQGSLFCTKHAQCRLSRRRYAYYKHELKMSPNEALQLVLQRLSIPPKKAQAA